MTVPAEVWFLGEWLCQCGDPHVDMSSAPRMETGHSPAEGPVDTVRFERRRVYLPAGDMMLLALDKEGRAVTARIDVDAHLGEW